MIRMQHEIIAPRVRLHPIPTISGLLATVLAATAASAAPPLALPPAGDVPAAMERLTAAATGADGSTQEAALKHIVALANAGLIPGSDARIPAAWFALVDRLAGERRFMEADEYLESAARTLGRTAEWKFHKAVLLEAAGSFEAGRYFADIQAITGEFHSDPAMRDLWKRLASKPAYRDSATAWRQQFERPRITHDQAKEKQFQHQWEGLSERPIGEDSQAYDQIIRDALEQDIWLPLPGGRTSQTLWLLVDINLRHRPPADLTPLREIQEALLREAYDQAYLDALTAPRHIEVFRRYPWADAAHRAMLRYARDELWAGHNDLAVKAYEDVIAHAADDTLKAQARQGLTLAEAGVAPTAATPAPMPLARLRLATVQPPDIAPWPTPENNPGLTAARQLDMQVAGDKLIVASPNMIGVYPLAAPEHPLWMYAVPDNTVYAYRTPGNFMPAVAQGALFTRWGYNGVPQDIAAIDLASGEMRWSTAQKAYWEKPRQFARQAPWPVADPVYTTGNRIYQLTYQLYGEAARLWEFMNGRYQQNNYMFVSGEGGRFVLFCIDADSGGRLWSAEVMHLGLGIGDKRRDAQDVVSDAALHGNAITLDRGQVYSDLSTGHIVASDARNGAPLWRFSYPRTLGSGSPYKGMSPQVSGDRILCSPRDYAGLFALDRHSGALLWQQSLAQPAHVLGLTQSTTNAAPLLIGHDGRQIFALNTANGAILWSRQFDTPLIASGILEGDTALVASQSQLFRVDVTNGRILETRDWNPQGWAMRSFIVNNGTLFAYSPDHTIAVGSPDTGITPLPHGTRDFPDSFGPQDQDVNVLLLHGRLSLYGLDPATAELRWYRRLWEPMVGLAGRPGSDVTYTAFGDQSRFVLDRRTGTTLGTYTWDRERNLSQTYNMTVHFTPDGRNLLLQSPSRPDLALQSLEQAPIKNLIYGPKADQFTWLYAAPPTLQMDGYLDDWTNLTDVLTLKAINGDDTAPTLRLAQGPNRIFAAVDYPNDRAAQFLGRGKFAIGDWMSLRIADEEGIRTSRFGVGEHGAIVGDGERLDYVEAGIRYDPRARHRIAEVAVPASGSPLVVQVSLQEGAGVGGRRLDYGPLLLHRRRFSRDQEAAIIRLASLSPDSQYARQLFWQMRDELREWPLEAPEFPKASPPADPVAAAQALSASLTAFSMNPQGLTFARGLAGLGGEAVLPNTAWRTWVGHYNRIEADLKGPFLLDEQGYIRQWMVLGWFPNPGTDTAREGLDIDYLWAHGSESLHLPEADRRLVAHTGHPATWTRYTSPDRMISFNRMPHLAAMGVHKHRHRIVVYSACWLEADRDMDVNLRIGSDDGHKVFLNHELIARQQYWGPAKTDYWSYPVHLAKGLHVIMVKVENRDGMSRFLMRVTDEDGNPAKGLNVRN